MKQQKFFVIVITVCALLLSLAGCASSSAFDGSSAKNADSYQLDVKTMNGTDTHTLELKQGDILSADMTNDFDQSFMKMKFTAEKTDDGTFLYTEYKGLLLCWSQGEGETGKGGDDEAESGYPGADVVELVNLRGDMTTVYKIADGTYMDCIERRFIYYGTDTWTDEDGGGGNCKF